MNLLRFAVPWNAGIAVLVEDGEEPMPLAGARVLGIPRSQAADAGALIERLRVTVLPRPPEPVTRPVRGRPAFWRATGSL